MTIELAYNGTQIPLVVDDEGRSIGGASWGVVHTTEALARRVLSSGQLILLDDEDYREVDNPDVREALANLDERRTRWAAAHELPKAVLVDVVGPETAGTLPTGKDGVPKKQDLEIAVAAGDQDIPDPAPPAAPAKKSTAPRRGSSEK